jgi:hypothetical protein
MVGGRLWRTPRDIVRKKCGADRDGCTARPLPFSSTSVASWNEGGFGGFMTGLDTHVGVVVRVARHVRRAAVGRDVAPVRGNGGPAGFISCPVVSTLTRVVVCAVARAAAKPANTTGRSRWQSMTAPSTVGRGEQRALQSTASLARRLGVGVAFSELGVASFCEFSRFEASSDPERATGAAAERSRRAASPTRDAPSARTGTLRSVLDGEDSVTHRRFTRESSNGSGFFVARNLRYAAVR